MNKITTLLKKSTTSLLVGFTFVFAFQLVGVPASNAQLFDSAKKDACNGAQVTASGAGNCLPGEQAKATKLIENIINLISVIIGVIAVVMIIVGGAKLITSSGDAQKVASGRNTILYAVIGLIVVAFAQIIVKFVLFRTNKGP